MIWSVSSNLCDMRISVIIILWDLRNERVERKNQPTNFYVTLRRLKAWIENEKKKRKKKCVISGLLEFSEFEIDVFLTDSISWYSSGLLLRSFIQRIRLPKIDFKIVLKLWLKMFMRQFFPSMSASLQGKKAKGWLGMVRRWGEG